jgi:hypothetical protein
MADSAAPAQSHERPSSSASSISSDSSTALTKSRANDDWVSRQMALRRAEFVGKFNIGIKIVSWNVNGKRITEDLTTLLDNDGEPGIYAIGYIPKFH